MLSLAFDLAEDGPDFFILLLLPELDHLHFIEHLLKISSFFLHFH